MMETEKIALLRFHKNHQDPNWERKQVQYLPPDAWIIIRMKSYAEINSLFPLRHPCTMIKGEARDIVRNAFTAGWEEQNSWEGIRSVS